MILKSLLIYYLFIFFQEKKSPKSKIFNFRLPDQTGTGARLEIARDAPPQFEQLSQKMGQ